MINAENGMQGLNVTAEVLIARGKVDVKRK